MKISFIRHFKTKGNLESRYVGKTDEDILPFEPTIIYPKSQIVFTSRYKRCIQTAKIIYPSAEILQVENLNETDFGDFEYKNFSELEQNTDYKAWLLSGGEIGFPNGENMADFCSRTIKGFCQCVEIARKKDLEEISFVIHGGNIMSILSFFTASNFYDYQTENGCGYLTMVENNKLKILGEIK